MIIYDARSGWVGTLLSLVGAFVIGYFLIPQYATASIAWWVFAAGLIALACWLVVADWGAWNPPVWLLLAASVVMTAFGAIGAAPSNGLLVVPAAVGVLRLIGEPRIDLWIGCAAALMAAALIALGSFAVTATPLGLLALEGAVALGLLGGINRRQSRAARERERELIERTMVAREEHARASALEARQRVARDIHDVLAHSLGGMVVQLDAVEALLESGRLDEAESRIRDARTLAASGLGEARRAVDALRTPADETGQTGAAKLDRSLRDLVSAHESMAGTIAFSTSGDPRDVSTGLATALRRALQESLSNARKHAPGVAVSAGLDWYEDRVVLTVSNPIVASGASSATVTALAATGGGNGLAGMAERLSALPGGSVAAGVSDDCFVVRAEVGIS